MVLGVFRASEAQQIMRSQIDVDGCRGQEQEAPSYLCQASAQGS